MTIRNRGTPKHAWDRSTEKIEDWDTDESNTKKPCIKAQKKFWTYRLFSIYFRKSRHQNKKTKERVKVDRVIIKKIYHHFQHLFNSYTNQYTKQLVVKMKKKANQNKNKQTNKQTKTKKKGFVHTQPYKYQPYCPHVERRG